MIDIKIINGELLDGTGSAAIRADIAVVGDIVSDIGNLSAVEAKLTLNAAGMMVCPGFIDAHSHSDAFLLIEPSSPSKVYQGITTEIVGNCGASAAPLVGAYGMPSDWADKEYPGKWRSVAEYRALLESVKPAPNVVLLIGHGALRAGVIGYDARPASRDELMKMSNLLRQSMEEGARGLSTGLIYAPGMFAPIEELIELARVAENSGGIYTSHMRSEGKYLLEAISEAIRIGREARVKVEISHLKTSGRDNWGLLDSALNLIRNARNDDVDVAADRYPYTSSCTDLDVVFPAWAAAGGRENVLSRLIDTSQRARLRKDLTASRPAAYWATVTIGSTSNPDNRRFRGMPLSQAADVLGMDPVDTVLHLCVTDELRTTAFFSGMSEDNMWRILAEPYVMLGTDASLRSPSGPLSMDHPHPRAYGSFPRFLRAAIDGKTVGLPEAVRKMTSLPAGHFNLKGRGVLARGWKADIAVSDPCAVADVATFGCPHQLATGTRHVIVNGIPALTDGKLTGLRPGRFL